MEKTLFADYPKDERLQMLEDNADAVEVISYLKHFESDELAEMKDDLVNALIQIHEYNLELAQIKSKYKEKIKPLAELVNENQEKIKMRAESIKGKCFKLVDYEAKMVGYYNPLGNLVFERPASRDEAQTNIVSMRKTVNQ